ncbi:MAG: helix-turn-helix transcriptional regulator [Halohasta sp.]
MNRRRADTVVGVLFGVVALGGVLYSWQLYRRQRAVDGAMGSMMDSSMGSMHGPSPLWTLFGTLLVVAVIGGGYLLVREELSTVDDSPHSTVEPAAGSVDGDSTESDSESPSESAVESTAGPESMNPEANPRKRVLDLLPDDERRVLEPVIDSPGITQIELRDRAEFSKSKVSQTVSDLESRGLLYRERQGRTYRVYPSDDLRGNGE